MKRTLVVFCVVALLGAGLALAQNPPAAPKPGPEHKKLEYFVGKWSLEGEMKPGPMGPGGKMTGSENCEWFMGGFHVVCHSAGKGPMGEVKGIGVMGYSSEGKHYTYYGIDNTGWADLAKGSVEGDAWSWTSEGTMGGKSMKGRYSIKKLTPDSYTFKGEISVADGPWTVMMEGKETRVK